VFACNGFDSNSDLSNQVPVFAYEFNDPNAPTLGTPGVPGPGANGSGFTTASQHAAELQYIFNFGAAFTTAQSTLASDMKTYWANFVKTGNPNNRGRATFVSLSAARAALPFWPHFNTQDNQIQSLTPQGLLTPQGPHPFDTFRTEHFCATWQPLLTFNNGNEPQQP
jgi:para-nitrobenzyl esterase